MTCSGSSKNCRTRYQEAFYNGDANDHLIEYAKQETDFDFWYDDLYMFLAVGLEWVVLHELQESATST